MAEELSKEILENARWCADSLKKNYEKTIKKRITGKRISEQQSGAIFYQFVMLFYHLTDRQLVPILSADEREAFMSILWMELFERSLHSSPRKELKEYRWAVADMYDDFISEFGKYKELVRDFDEGLGGTLFFEFSRRITRLTPHPNDIRVIILCHGAIMGALEDLNLNEKIKAIRN